MKDLWNTFKMSRCFWWFKHKTEYQNGLGYRCCRCGKPKSQCK
ncbi:hypothetical protein ACR77J_11885 [Tissierella praeacuta]|nr:hypothetical protein [Tissierella praeacuta]